MTIILPYPIKDVELGHMESIYQWVSEHFATWYGYLIALLAAIGGLLSLWDNTFGRWSVIRNLWPSRETWNAHCLPATPDEPNMGRPELEANIPLHYPGQRWCQMRNMKVGDYYHIDMQKDRVITRLQLVTYGRAPKKYKIEIATNDTIDRFRDLGIYSDSPMDIKLPHAKKFRVVKFTIIEPDILPNNAWHSWCIYDVRFTEARLFGNWFKRIILPR